MECRVLSIQSHVVRGYVGNKSASFPLQVSIIRGARRLERHDTLVIIVVLWCMTACWCWRKERSHGQYCLACCSCAIWDIYVVNFPYIKSRLLHSQNLASWCWLQWYTRLNLKYAPINSYLVNWLSQNLKLWLISSCCQNTGSVNCNTAAVANARSEWVTPVNHHQKWLGYHWISVSERSFGMRDRAASKPLNRAH